MFGPIAFFVISIAIVGLLIAVLVIILQTKEHFKIPSGDYASLQYNIVPDTNREKMLAEFANIKATPAPPTQAEIDDLRKQLLDWYSITSQKGLLRPMDKWGKISIEAALDSISMGNWGIGNVLVYMPPGKENNPEEWIELLRGGNRFFTRSQDGDILSTKNPIPRFDSHGHGEMVVLDAFEDRLSRGMYDKSSPYYSFPKNSPIDFRKKNDLVGYSVPDGIVLFTQLNSCQMCLSRVGNAGISRTYWLGPDTGGGMAHRLCDSVPAYFNMLNRQLHAVADVSPQLIQFAFDVFNGPNAKWLLYCVWKLNELAAPGNAKADYKYCPGQWYANPIVGQNAMYDPNGWYVTVPKDGAPNLKCQVTPPGPPQK